jgi:ADP-heptose:LPS heptosyltransferase
MTPKMTPARRIILTNSLSPGDVVMLTAAVRDLHRTYPNQFITDVRTSCAPLWENNPYRTPIPKEDNDAKIIACEYPLIHKSNTGPWHFINGFHQFLSERLGVEIRPTDFKGDIHLSPAEKRWMSQVQEITRDPVPFWIIAAGGRFDFTAKWWPVERYQAVVNHFRGRILICAGWRKGSSSPCSQWSSESLGTDRSAAVSPPNASRAGRALPCDVAHASCCGGGDSNWCLDATHG